MQFKNKILLYFQKFLLVSNYLFSKGFDEQKLYKSCLKNKSIVFDVGSNLGSFIEVISTKNSHKVLTFYAFEPNKNLQNIGLKIAKNRLHEIKINKFAITSKIGKVNIYINSISSQSSVNRSQIIGNILTKEEVDSITLDYYCEKNNIDSIDLLKIDVEGLELEVLKSAEILLSNKKVNLIKIEVSTKNYLEVLKYLQNFGYVLIGLNNQTYINNKLEIADYFFKRL